MRRKITLAAIVLALTVWTVAVYANPGKPNFGPALYGDGEVWGTKGAANLPAPNDHNLQSFDKLFVIVNGAPGQMPVAEAAPGNPMYNGGRWFTHTVMWLIPNPPVVTSYEQIEMHEDLGELAIAAGSPGGPGAPPDYFECPLLPVK
jgi:hypothetical protein